MRDSLNVLILSCGTRNKIVQYFKQELNGRGQLFATDSSELAPALYEADRHLLVPKINEPNYLEAILSICKDNNIKGVFSLIDPELSLLAKYKEKFLEIGTMPIVSDYDVVELCFDKFKMYKHLVQNDIPTVRSYIDKEEFYEDLKKKKINYPVFVKPVKGSASINISKVHSNEEIELLFNRYDNLMIQEFMDGAEYGVDAYIDMITGEPVAIFIKEKIKMRAGETDKSVSIKDDFMLGLVQSFIQKTGFKGVIDIDIFKVDGKYYISEVNPRFGGGYPHAYECGVNIPKLILNNLNKKLNTMGLADYKENICMMKFNEVKIIDKSL